MTASFRLCDLQEAEMNVNLSNEVRDAWERTAEWWDQTVGY